MEQTNRTQVQGPPLMVAIDLGSNSFHMIVARVDHNEVRPLERFGKKVQLAKGLHQGELTDEAITRGLACLAEFAQYMAGKVFKSVRIVGTSALRSAKNSDVFVKKAKHILPYPIEIIAGREEARLIYLGVAQTQSDDDRRLVIDIGGGSTELIIGEKFEPKMLESLHMGCVTFTERYFHDGKITPERFQSAYYAARLEVQNIAKAYHKLGWTDVVGSSGSISAISAILQSITSGGTITPHNLKLLENKILHFQDLKSLQIAGLRSERKKILPAGLAILQACFDAFQLKQMQFSSGALREGVLYDLLGRDRHENVKERTIKALEHRYHSDLQETDNIAKHARHCFQVIHKNWSLSLTDDLPVLIWAARLCKIGLDISHSQFHLHGAYIITHSDLLGFSKHQQQEIAFLVGHHRRSIPENQCDLRLLKLVIILRLACLIHNSDLQHDTKSYNLKAGKKKLALQLPTQWLSNHPLTRTELEYEKKYLSKVGYMLVIESG